MTETGPRERGGTKPRERFLDAVRGRRPGRAPTACPAALTPVELQEATGCRMPAAHLDAEKLVRLCAANHEALGFDGVSFVINFFNEPAALGAPMDWGSPTVLPRVSASPWRSPDDARAPADLLLREPLRTNLEALALARARHGGEIAVLGKVMGPLSMTQVLHGIESTMLGLVDEPDRIRRFLDACVDIATIAANAQLEAGADAILIGEGGAGAQMLSPAMYERFLVGPHVRLIASIRGPSILHMCGDITPRLHALARLGLWCFNFDSAIAPDVMRAAAGGSAVTEGAAGGNVAGPAAAFRCTAGAGPTPGRYAIMGNVDTTALLLSGPEEIEAQVVACLRAGVDIISPGCAVSPLCPVRNFQALTGAVGAWTARRAAGA